jgi:hypothetical protein
MSNPGTATFLTTAAVARFHHHKVQANACLGQRGRQATARLAAGAVAQE